jgi:hypothetical protein
MTIKTSYSWQKTKNGMINQYIIFLHFYPIFVGYPTSKHIYNKNLPTSINKCLSSPDMTSIHIKSLSYQFYSDLLMSYFIILLLLPISKSILFPAFLTNWIFFHYFLIICWLGHHELFLGFCVRYGKRRCKYTDNIFENSQFSKVY